MMNNPLQVKYLLGFLLLLLATACTVNNSDMGDDAYASQRLKPEYYGEFSGFWTVEGKKVAEAQLQIGAQQVYSLLPLTEDMRQLIAEKLGVKTLDNVQQDEYAVFYQETNYSAASLYLGMASNEYTLKTTVKNNQHTISMTMEQGSGVAVYDKQTTAFVALFKLRQIQIDGQVLKTYRPALTIQFNSNKKTRTSGV